MKTDTLDVIQIGDLFDLRLVDQLWVGEWHAISWESVRPLAAALCALSAQVCERPSRDFVIEEFVSPAGDKARVGARVVYSGKASLEESTQRHRVAAVKRLTEIISTDGNALDCSLPLDPDLPSDNAVREVAKEFLQKNGGKRIPSKLDVFVGKSAAAIPVLRLANKPVDEITRSEYRLEGFVESLDRPERSCKIVTMAGATLPLKFKVEADLGRLRDALCSDRLYAIDVSNVLDAKGRAGEIISDISLLHPADGKETLALQPSPQGSRRIPVQRRTKPQ